MSQNSVTPISRAPNTQDNTYTDRLRRPAILDFAARGEVGFFVQFGGQAAGYIDDLRHLYNDYPLLRTWIEAAITAFREETSQPEMQKSGALPWGTDVLRWLTEPETTPPASYLTSSIVSQPLIFMTQISHLVHLFSYGCRFEDLRRFTRGTTGHSQGLMSAILFSAAKNEDDFKSEFVRTVRYFTWQGLRMQQAFPATHVPAELIKECLSKDWGTPSPMAAIQGFTPEELAPFLKKAGELLPKNRGLTPSLINGWRRVVISGSPEGLVVLRRILALALQTKVRFEFLAVQGPYHSPHMTEALQKFRQDLKKLDFKIQARDLKIPVYATNDGRDLPQSTDLAGDLTNMQFLNPVDWAKATSMAGASNGVTHVLDFGPGEMASALTFINREGTGVVVLPYGTTKGKEKFLTPDVEAVSFDRTLWQNFAPQLTRLADNTLAIDNAFVRLTGKPPIFGGGMTPTTVETEIVSAAANAGYLVEWAGGGQVTEGILRQRADELSKNLNPGEGFILNCLYLDAYLWGLHYPLVQKLKSEGYPVDGITISAGVPTREKASEILATLRDSGLWCNSFKPGSDDQIRSVLEIADDHPDHTLLIQIEGGKAGGHHSWEDLYGLIERNYASIRRRKNLVLCVGGGIASEDEASRWLMGTWHASGRIMPVDAVFLGTRLMACLEAKTSLQVKKLLTKIEGTKDWVQRGEFKSGVTSGQSQLGADVHYADNAASRTAAWIDEISQKDEAEILNAKNEIIVALAKTAKPYFGDVANMNYAQVLARLCALMAPGDMPEHIPHDGVWFDVSYKQRFRDFARRAFERLNAAADTSVLMDSAFDNPQSFLKTLAKVLPTAETTVLHSEDVDYFLALCRRPGKPVNFVPVIDKTIKRWFKSDSLWQAHDPRYSADEVLTIPGTLAVNAIQKPNEPVAEIFKAHVDNVIEHLKPQTHTTLRSQSFVGARALPIFANPPTGIKKTTDNQKTTFVVVDKITPKTWFDFLATQTSGALQTALQAPSLAWGKNKTDNMLQKALFPELGLQATFSLQKNNPTLEILAADGRGGLHLVSTNNTLDVTWLHPSPDGKIATLTLPFAYHPKAARAPLFLDSKVAQVRVADFYRLLWLGETKTDSRQNHADGIWQEFVSQEKITQAVLHDFLAATSGAPTPSERTEAIPGLSIALLWKPLAECLFQPELQVDFLKLLHLSNHFEVLADSPLQVDDVVTAKIRLRGLINEAHGRTLTVEGVIERDKQIIVKLTTRFLIRVPSGTETVVEENHFNETHTVPATELVRDYLATATWYQPKSTLTVGESDLLINIKGMDRKLRNGNHDNVVVGEVHQHNKLIAEIALTQKAVADRISPVRFFIKRFAKAGAEIPLKSGLVFNTQIAAPATAHAYALASFDLNPIHTDSRLAGLANLPLDAHGQSTPIIHGMWTSAAALASLQRAFPQAVKSWHTDFVGMVMPGEILNVQARHVASRAGRRILNVTVTNQKEQTLLSGVAEVLQNATAYIFTGQGSQATGMGMPAYDTSAAAREMWDKADKYCQNELGFSILKIVRDNPKEDDVRGEHVFHPKGILNLTQFAQVGLTVLAMAQIAELQAAGVYPPLSAFAGHSLGEYAALSCAGIIPLESVIRVVYQRGLTMQHFVPRDAQGRSPYAMVVVRPNIVGWSEAKLSERVQSIAKSGNGELYVVNYNIEGMQYSITGQISLLQKLEAELKTCERERGATKTSLIWIDGVDVPFHSPILKPGVAAFRDTLEKTIPQNFDANILIGHYIPNLNAEPFQISKAYAQSVADLTGSPVLQKALANWPKDPTDCARLLLIELLAYQFASPVQWTRTQKVLLHGMHPQVGSIVEIGPSAVLSNMLRATLLQEKLIVPPTVLHFDSQRDELFGISAQSDDAVTSESASTASNNAKIEAAPIVASTTTASTAPAERTAPARQQTTSVAPQDKPYSLAFALRCLIALKLNVRPDEIRDSETLEALSGGNSARRNEILSEIGAEFQIGAIDDAHQMPLEKLAQALATKSAVTSPGPVLQKFIERALKEKVALAKKDVIEYLQNERMLPAGLLQTALAFLPTATRAGVSTRAGALSNIALTERLNDRQKSLSWLDEMADAFGVSVGVAVPKRSQAAQSSESLVSGEALAALENKYFGTDSPFANWARDLAELAGWSNVTAETADFTEELQQLKMYKSAFGAAVERVVTPLFEARKIVSFSSSWNWVKRDLVSWSLAAIQNNVALSATQLDSLKTRATLELADVINYLQTAATTENATATAKSLAHLLQSVQKNKNNTVSAQFNGPFTAPQVQITSDGHIDYQEVSRAKIHSTAEWFDNLRKIKAVSGDVACLKAWQTATAEGMSFSGRTALITGAAPGSIAWEAMRQILAGGGRVIATTSSYTEERVHAFRSLYQNVAAAGAELHVVPFSQGAKNDIDALIDWCFAKRLAPDILIPFAAVGEAATLTMMSPDASTATLRVLLQGVEWLIAGIAKGYRHIRAFDKSCLTLLPLSPNHGVFGGDGAYADAKLGLEALLNRWHAEHDDWGRFVSLVGTTIGWVRGTGLMLANNLLAATLEEQAHVRTFANNEAGFLLASLCTCDVAAAAQKQPLRAAFTGGFETVSNLAKLSTESRQNMEHTARLRRELSKVQAEEKIQRFGEAQNTNTLNAKSAVEAIFPTLPTHAELKNFARKNSIDAKNTIVVVGYGEVSPFGSSRPRFEMECSNQLSMGGAIELCWIMGLIRYEDGTGRGGYVGWVDAKSNEPVADAAIFARYQETIRNNTGVRFTDPEIQGFDPQSVVIFGDIVLENTMSFTVESLDVANTYQKQYGESVRVEKIEAGFKVTLAKGAIVKVPRRQSLTRWVAGQIPKGWDATHFGIPKDMATQIDRNTLFNLVSSAKAFDTAGLTPEELLQSTNPALIANSQGGGMGGMTAMDHIYHDLREDRPRQGDALQEILINVGPAWVTQSLTGGYGPTVNPVAACATALVSLGVGCDLIQQGKADFVVAGGYDDYSEEGVLGFQDMAATCDTAEMLAKGISAKSMSRPNDSRRGGFVEAQGGGTLLITSLQKAIDDGLPIYGILAYANNYSDGIHTSIPAPGLGLLGMAGDAQNSPLAQALKTLGLTADDITVVSKHDTSTAANDPNENKLHQVVQHELGRTAGNPLIVHSQKAMLGHAKGGAGAWQSVAALQMLASGVVPGNPNLEDVDVAMRGFQTLCFTDQAVNFGQGGIKAVIATSLGFGHVGAASLFVHPNFVLSQLSANDLETYRQKRAIREIYARQRTERVLMGKEPLFKQRKNRLSETQEIATLLQKPSVMQNDDAQRSQSTKIAVKTTSRVGKSKNAKLGSKKDTKK